MRSSYWQWWLTVASFVALFAVVTAINPRFASVENLVNIGRQMAPNAIVAVGMTMVILTAGIDLSVGSLLCVAGVSAAMLLKAGLPVWLAVPGGMAVSGLLGSFNGLVVAWGRLPPFVVTLAMMTIARSAGYLLTGGSPVTELPRPFAFFGRATVAGVPVPILVTAALYLWAYLLLGHFSYGRHVYAIGGNEEAARLSGINTRLVVFSTYAISGLCAGLAGVILTSRVMAGDPTLGVAYELEAIAAVVIGGTSLMGGSGHILGTLLGAFIVQALNNALTLLGVTPYYQGIVKGAVILFAVLASRRK